MANSDTSVVRQRTESIGRANSAASAKAILQISNAASNSKFQSTGRLFLVAFFKYSLNED